MNYSNSQRDGVILYFTALLFGAYDPNPEKRAQWRRIPCKGELPTPDEWLQYAVMRIKENGRDELLRKYLNW